MVAEAQGADPRAEARGYCEELLFGVAAARAEQQPAAYAEALIRACFGFPAYPSVDATPVNGWLDELERCAKLVGAQDELVFVAARRAVILAREGKAVLAREALAPFATLASDADLRPERLTLRAIAEFEVATAEGVEEDDGSLSAIASSGDLLLATLAAIAVTNRAAARGEPDMVERWERVLSDTPGPMLDTRVYALHRLCQVDEKDRAFLMQLLAEIHFGSGTGRAIVALAERYPGVLSEAEIALARATPERPSRPPGPARPATDDAPIGLATKIGCAALVFCVVAVAAMMIYARL